MEKVISPFVGFYPDFKHPFSVANSHNTAREYLMDDRREKGIIIKGLPECFGFVIKAADGTYRYADRKEAFQVAKAAGQLKDDYPNTVCLESYMIDKYDGTEPEDLARMILGKAKEVSGMKPDDDLTVMAAYIG